MQLFEQFMPVFMQLFEHHYFYLKNTGTMDTVQNNDFNSDILEPSSVTFRIY
jgi:hypothetical protein